MQKQIGSILLVAGTCIGSGMIALPMVLAKLGIIFSIILMLFIWMIMYFTSLVNLELNLQAGKGLNLGSLGQIFSGRVASLIGTVSLKLLSYSLLAVFIYGGSSVMQKLLDTTVSTNEIATCYAVSAILILLLPLKITDYLNRILFIGLLVMVALLVAGLITMISWGNLPLLPSNTPDLAVWTGIIPVVFTSFGFQVIFHTLTNYCNKDIRMLQKTFFWGSLIPAIIYIIWTASILCVVHHQNPPFYLEMISGKVDVGDLVKELSLIAKIEYIQILIWWLSLLAIITSILGVGIGLCDSYKSAFVNILPNYPVRNVVAAVITIIPAYIVATLVPNAFITVLGFAGMILAVIAILLPIFLLHKIKTQQYNYPQLNKKYLINISVVVGILVIFCEVFNMMK